MLGEGKEKNMADKWRPGSFKSSGAPLNSLDEAVKIMDDMQRIMDEMKQTIETMKTVMEVDSRLVQNTNNTGSAKPSMVNATLQAG